MKFSIVIPAYNEEEAIGRTVDRSLAAEERIISETRVSSVEVIVVSDGSTDRTAEITRQRPRAKLIEFPRNRGYGAAIQAGFEAAEGDLLGFLDADGTCDPEEFAPMIQALLREKADVVSGSRIGPESEMPPVRRLGNALFAGLIRIWGGVDMKDSASGMRVVRRATLPLLYPLPTGMHFTPAMSTRAVMDSRLKLVEIPISYGTRIGRSKLGVLSDGLRFLDVISEIALTYRPFRFFGVAGGVLLAIAVLYGIGPVAHYVAHGRIEEDMIYRLLSITVFSVTGICLISAGTLSQRMVAIINGEPPPSTPGWVEWLFVRRFLVYGAVFLLCGVVLNVRTIIEYITRGTIEQHWVYVVAGGFLVLMGAATASFGVIARILRTLELRHIPPRLDESP